MLGHNSTNADVLFCSNGILYVLMWNNYWNMINFTFAPHVHKLQIILCLPSTSSPWPAMDFADETLSMIFIRLARSLNCPVYSGLDHQLSKPATQNPSCRGTPFESHSKSFLSDCLGVGSLECVPASRFPILEKTYRKTYLRTRWFKVTFFIHDLEVT